MNFSFNQSSKLFRKRFSDIILEDARVRLSLLKLTDIECLDYVVNNEPNLLKYSPSKWGSSEALMHYISKAVKQFTEDQRIPLLIFDKNLEKHVGSTSFMNIDMINSRVEIGSTWISKISQGSGLNKHMKYQMINFAFENLKMERVEFKTDKLNLQSRRAIEKLGAQYEGCLRRHMLMTDGRRRDTVYYSIIKPEWESLKKERFSQFISNR